MEIFVGSSYMSSIITSAFEVLSSLVAAVDCRVDTFFLLVVDSFFFRVLGPGSFKFASDFLF